MSALLPAAFVLGAVHGLGPDHCAAVLSLAARSSSGKESVRLAVRFGAGHAVVLALAGGAAAGAGLVVPQDLSTLAESVCGALLVGMGLFTLLSPRGQGITLHRHDHEHPGAGEAHAHWHAHARGEEAHAHRHVAFGTGALFALSGLRALLLAAPVAAAAIRSPLEAAGAVLTFAAGVVASMAAFGILLRPFLDMGRRTDRLAQLPRLVAGLACVAVGAVLATRAA